MVQQSNSNDLGGPQGATNYLKITEGSKVKLSNGAIAEVTANPNDGAWLFIRILEHPDDSSQVGTEEMVFFPDVETVI